MTSAAAVPVRSLEALESELVGLAGHLAAAHCRWLRLLAEFDAREGWAGPGLRSCAHWLSWRVGMSLRTGFEQVRVAHALTGLPQVSAAFAAGRISYSKVRAISRVATAESEQPLLDLALAGTASHVERVVRAVRQERAVPTEVEARRGLDWQWDDDGSLVLRGRFTAEQGTLLLAAIEHTTTRAQCSAERRDAGAPGGSAADQSGPAGLGGFAAEAGEPRAAPGCPGRTRPSEALASRRADALIALVTGAESATPEVVVVVDEDGGAIGEPGPGRPTAHYRGGPAVPFASAERMGCTARVRALVRDRRGNPLFLGRGRRLASRSQLAALHVRDHGRCRFPGCEETRHLDAHHIVHWMRGGRTDVDNLILCCDRHHRLVHDHGYRITGQGVDVEFHRPDGCPIRAAGPTLSGSPRELLERHSEPTITDRTIVPTWAGEPLDLYAALDSLLPHPRRAPAA